jgi:hypothetical protein
MKTKHVLWNLIVLLFVVGSLISCTSPQHEDRSSVSVSKTIVPGGNKSEEQVRSPENTATEDYYREENVPRVDTFPNEIILQVINVNLDFDRIDEQILVIKDRQQTIANIEIVVIDFNNVHNSYEVSWQSKTSAINIRNFTVSLEDIVGDHNLEIICFGSNQEGSRTLDVFRKTHPPQGVGLYYNLICKVSSEGTIEIKRQERTQAYKLGQKNGVSFPIITYSQDPESENMLDLIKHEYYWKYQAQEYVLGKTEKIPGKRIEEKQLQELFHKNVEAYEDFMEGLWYRSGSNESSTTMSGYETIHFDPVERNITFFEQDVQEVYNWKSSHKTRIPNSFYINGQNQLVPFIEKQISIHIVSLDTIKIVVHDNDLKKSGVKWDGTYTKISEQYRDVFNTAQDSPKTISSSSLEGKFTSDNDETLIFDYPHFRFVINDQELEGRYNIYAVGNTHVLDMKIMDDNGLVKETRRYGIDYQRQMEESIITHTCTLIPGKVKVQGFVPDSDQQLKFQRIEIVEDDKEKEAEQVAAGNEDNEG